MMRVANVFVLLSFVGLIPTAESAPEIAKVNQNSYGHCSPNIANVSGSVTVNCNGNVTAQKINDLQRKIDKMLRDSKALDWNAKRQVIMEGMQTQWADRIVKTSSDDRVGRLSFSVDVAEGDNDIRKLFFQDKFDISLYAGPIFENWDSSRMAPEVEDTLKYFAQRLANVAAKQIRIETRLAKPCPYRIRKQCAEKYRHGYAQAYAMVLGQRYAENIKRFILESAGASAEEMVSKIETLSLGYENPDREYPDEKMATAEEWEAAANRNFLVNIKVKL